MLASISPVGEASRRQRWSVTVAAYLVASAIGGAAVGGSLGAVGQLLDPRSWGQLPLVALATVTGLSAAVDAGWLRVRLPTRRRQVDERWLSEYRGWVYGAGYGIQLGAAVVTIIPAAITYAVLVAALLSGRAATGGLIGLTFGVVRAVPLLLIGFVRTSGQLRALHRRLASASTPAARGTVAVQVLIAGVAVIAILGAPADGSW